MDTTEERRIVETQAEDSMFFENAWIEHLFVAYPLALAVVEAAEAWRKEFEADEWGTDEVLLERQMVLRNALFARLDAWHTGGTE